MPYSAGATVYQTDPIYNGEDLLPQQTQVFWRRIGAWFVDGIILSFLIGVSGNSFMGGGGPSLILPLNTSRDSTLSIQIPWDTLILVTYFTICEWQLGASLGKLVSGIRVVGLEGQPIKFWQSLVRNILRPIDYFLVLGLLMIHFTKAHQRLGDKAARTVVVGIEYIPVSSSIVHKKVYRWIIVLSMLVILFGASYLMKSYLQPPINEVLNASTIPSCVRGYTLNNNQAIWSIDMDGTPTVTYHVSVTTSQSSQQTMDVVLRWNGFLNGGWKLKQLPTVHCPET
jgi:uncharacterized RDD family membrane protein YckC